MISHALLPVVSNATLPVKYTAATIAIAECERIDECKDWADKSAALASYAKQSGDKTLEHAAMRIRARAIRRCGELLAEVEKATGAHLKSGGEPTFSRKDAATAAGMSKDQAVTALRVANIPPDDFEAQVEGAEPPTITALAEQGKKPANVVPLYERLGMTRQQFQAGMYFRGDVRSYLAACEKYPFAEVAAGCTPEERETLRADLERIAQYNRQLKSAL